MASAKVLLSLRDLRQQSKAYIQTYRTIFQGKRFSCIPVMFSY